MAGHIRTKQSCPKCQGKFQGQPLTCPTCIITPTRYFLDLWWRGRLKIYTDPRGFPLDSWAAAEQLISTIRHQIRRGKFDPAEYVARELKSLRFDNYCLTWVVRRQVEVGRPGGISRAYFRELRRYALNYFIPFFDRAIIREIRKGDLLDFKAWLPEHLSPKSLSNILGALHALFAEAFDRKDINLLPGFPKVPRGEPHTRWLTPEEQGAILAHCREPYRTFFLFCMKQGCRLGEARALKWNQVDLKGKVVTIAAGMDLGQWKPYTKERDVRHLPLNSQVRQALMALPRTPGGFVFINRAGRPLSDTRVRSAWKKAAIQAGLDINAYEGTRHSFCTQKLIAGHSERKVMECSGHKTIEAFRRYGKMVTEALREVVEDRDTVPKLSPTH
jgi:integrase